METCIYLYVYLSISNIYILKDTHVVFVATLAY